MIHKSMTTTKCVSSNPQIAFLEFLKWKKSRRIRQLKKIMNNTAVKVSNLISMILKLIYECNFIFRACKCSSRIQNLFLSFSNFLNARCKKILGLCQYEKQEVRVCFFNFLDFWLTETAQNFDQAFEIGHKTLGMWLQFNLTWLKIGVLTPE